jgi:hypothetical protein
MDILSLIGLSMLGVMVVVSVLGVTWAILRNYRIGLQFREKLAEFLVGRMRLGKMMDTLGIDRNRYLHELRVTEIERHMRKCRSCDSLDACDDYLEAGNAGARSGEGHDRSTEFCPNREELLTYREHQASR